MRGIRVPRSALNLILFVVCLSSARYVMWYFFDWTVESSELISVTGTFAAASVGYSLLSETAQNWFKSLAAAAFSTEAATKYLLIFIVFFALVSLFVGRIDLVYNSNQNFVVKINEAPFGISSDGKSTRKANLGIIFSTATFSVGRFSASKNYLPFVKAEVQIPFSVSTEFDMDLQRIEGQLSYAFFQFYESKYLASANAVIAAQSIDSNKKEALTRLSLIAQILEFGLLAGDVSGARNDLLNRFHGEFSNDGWTNALDAVVAYSDGDYFKATQILSTKNDYESKWPGALALEFFKSVCFLKSSRNAGEPQRSERLAAALNGFKHVEALAAKQPEASFQSHALASSVVFQAIHGFYVQDIPGAKAEFLRAASFAKGSLRARALNGAGFLEFVEGNLGKAEIDFLDALDSDPSFAYALSNYGYVLMAKDQYDIAARYFEQNAKNAELRATSPRDVLLAEVALGHVNEQLKKDPSEASSYYAAVLKSSGHRDFSAVTPVELRLAYQYTEMADRIYLSKDYFGLEVFALALLSKAKALMESPPQNDMRYQELSGRIDALIATTKANVPIAWFRDERSRGAFFSQIKRY